MKCVAFAIKATYLQKKIDHDRKMHFYIFYGQPWKGFAQKGLR